MHDILKVIAPTIATALLGPLGGAAIAFLADKFGAKDATMENIKEIISGLKGDDLLKMKELDLEFQKFMAENGIKLQLAQIDVNKEEAKSTSLFIAGWRPAVGWVGAIGLGYVAIIEPVFRFFAQVVFAYTGAFPVIDTSLTMQVLSGLIGFGIMRTYEKSKNVESKR